MFSIGPYQFPVASVLAPMAGVTDRPFRQLCRRLGAGHVVSEMVASNPQLKHSRKSSLRRDHQGEPAPISVQIVGGDAEILAQAAQDNVAEGAQIIDINMGCPAKKVCRKAAGSALLADEGLVRDILHSVVQAVTVPVTLKIRTGPDPSQRNGVRIAEIAAAAGIQALAIHGRTRACRFNGNAEYDTIRAIKQAVDIPIIANGDIQSARQALEVLEHTGADAVMIGRAAQGNPWIFRELACALNGRALPPPPSYAEVAQVMLEHVRTVHQFYGPEQGVRVVRKHLSWYLEAEHLSQAASQANQVRDMLMRAEQAEQQLELLDGFFSTTLAA